VLTFGHWGQRHIAIEKYLSMMEDHQATTYKTDCKKMRATSSSPLGALPVQQEGRGSDCAVRATGFGGAGDVRTVDVQPLLRAAQKSRSMAQTYLLECAQVYAEEEMRLEALEEGDESHGELGVGVAGEEATGAKEDKSEEEVQSKQEGKGQEGSEDDGGMDADAAAECALKGEDRVHAPGDQEKRDWVVTPVKGFCAAEKPDLPEATGGVGPMRQQEAQGLEEVGAEGQKGGWEAKEFTPAKEPRRRNCFISGIPTTPPRFPSSLAPEQVQQGAEKSESNAGGRGRDCRPPRRWIVDAKQGTRWDCAPSLLGGMRSGVLEPATGYDTDVTGEGEGGGGGNAGDQVDEALGDGARGRACEGVHLPSTPAGARKSAPNGVRTTQFVTEALAAHSRDARRVCLRAQGFVTPKTKDRVEEWVRVHVPLGEDHPECRTLFRASSDSTCKSPRMPTDGEERAHTLAQEWQPREALHCEERGWDGNDSESCGVDSLGGTEADDVDAMRREEEDEVTPLKSELRCGTVKRWAGDAFAGDFGEIQGDFDEEEEGQGEVQARGARIVPYGRKYVVGLRAEHDDAAGQGEVQVRGTGVVPHRGTKVVGLGAEQVRRDGKAGQVVSGVWMVAQEGVAGLGDGCGEEDKEVQGEWSAGARGVEAARGSEGRLPTDALLQYALHTYTQAAAREDSAEEVEEDLIVEEEEEEEEEEKKEKEQDVECELYGQGEGRCTDIAPQEACAGQEEKDVQAEEEEAVSGFSRNRTIKRIAAPLALDLEANVVVKGEESTADEVTMSSTGSAASHKSTKSSGERRREAWETEQQVCDLDPAHTSSPTAGPRQHKRYKKSSRGTEEGRMRSGGKYLGYPEDKENMSPQLADKSQLATISAKRLTPRKAQVGLSPRREGEDAEGEEGWGGKREAPPPQTPSPINLRSVLRKLRCE